MFVPSVRNQQSKGCLVVPSPYCPRESSLCHASCSPNEVRKQVRSLTYLYTYVSVPHASSIILIISVGYVITSCTFDNIYHLSALHHEGIMNIIIVIIYRDFLPPPRRGSHGKSDNTHTIIQHIPLSPYTLHLRLHFQ